MESRIESRIKFCEGESHIHYVDGQKIVHDKECDESKRARQIAGDLLLEGGKRLKDAARELAKTNLLLREVGKEMASRRIVSAMTPQNPFSENNLEYQTSSSWGATAKLVGVASMIGLGVGVGYVAQPQIKEGLDYLGSQLQSIDIADLYGRVSYYGEGIKDCFNFW